MSLRWWIDLGAIHRSAWLFCFTQFEAHYRFITHLLMGLVTYVWKITELLSFWCYLWANLLQLESNPGPLGANTMKNTMSVLTSEHKSNPKESVIFHRINYYIMSNLQLNFTRKSYSHFTKNLFPRIGSRFWCGSRWPKNEGRLDLIGQQRRTLERRIG